MFSSYPRLIIHFIHWGKIIIIIITKKKLRTPSKGLIASNKLGYKICF